MENVNGMSLSGTSPFHWPALSSACGELLLSREGAMRDYGKQFNLPIAKFEDPKKR